MTKSTRWLAVRYAMLRWAEKCRTIRLAKTASAGNCGDIMTKCLTGPVFFRHRATVLGLVWDELSQPESTAETEGLGAATRK